MGNTTKTNWSELFFKNIYVPYTSERYITDLNEFTIDRNEYKVPYHDHYYLLTFAANKHKLDESLDLALDNLQKFYKKDGLILIAPNDDCSKVQCENFDIINQKVKDKLKDYEGKFQLFVKQDIIKPHSHLLKYFFFKAKNFPNQPNTLYMIQYKDEVDKNKNKIEECKRLFQLNQFVNSIK